MVLNEISPGRQYLPINQQNNEMKGIELPGGTGGKFVDTFKEFVSDVNSFQQESNSLEENVKTQFPVKPVHFASGILIFGSSYKLLSKM